MAFRDREDAGRQLARLLEPYRGPDTRVIGLPRGGVVVGYEVARALEAPLDVWVVRKIGAPFQPELGMGAIAEGGGVYLDGHIIRMVGATEEEVEDVMKHEARELERRVRAFRGGRPPVEVKGRTVVLVDDGIATGGTVRAAIRAIRPRGPRRLVLAVPVAATQSLEALAPEVDAVVCAISTPHLVAVGGYYLDFAQTSDEEVLSLLEANRREIGEPDAGAATPPA